MEKRAHDTEVPDTILPAQYFTRSGSSTPEKRLIFAVLMDAVTQLQSGDTEDARDAERWIRGEIADVLISFPSACDALGLEANGLADGLMSWRTQFRRVPRIRQRVTPPGRLRSRAGRPAVLP